MRRLITVLAAVLLAGLIVLWGYRGLVGESIPTEYPVASAHLRQGDGIQKLDVRRATGSLLVDVLDLKYFGMFRPVRSLEEARQKYGSPDQTRRPSEHRTTLDYSLGSLGRIEVSEEFVGEGRSYSIHAFPNNVSANIVLKGPVISLLRKHVNLSADRSLVVIEDTDGGLEALVTLRGSRVEEISW